MEKQSKLRTGERGSLGHSATDALGLRDVAARGGTAGSGQRRQAVADLCAGHVCRWPASRPPFGA